MRTVEYRIWCPPGSPFGVEFRADLIRGLGIAETSGVLYGSRHGGEIRIASIKTPRGEEEKKVGVFFSRIRGEVFLTEADLAFFNEHQSEVALVVAGDRAGFFVREAGGSIQTVRSHEEFSVAPLCAAAPKKLVPALKWPWTFAWTAAPAWLVMLAVLPIAALAVLPQRSAVAKPLELQVHEIAGQLRISWKPGQNAVLAIDDGGTRLSIPVYANQSSVTYAPRGSEVKVSLLTVDAEDQPRRESALYISSIGSARGP
jgi:hypothetical protein